MVNDGLYDPGPHLSSSSRLHSSENRSVASADRASNLASEAVGLLSNEVETYAGFFNCSALCLCSCGAEHHSDLLERPMSYNV